MDNNTHLHYVLPIHPSRARGVLAALLLLALSFPSLPAPALSQEASPSTSALKKMSLEELMDLDVTSVSKQPEPYGQAPAAIEVVTGEEIRRSGASSIPEALRLADNLEVDQKASHNWAISARGFNTDSANKLLVLMDGRSVYTPLFSGVFWDVQDTLLEDLDRIEVVSGPGGTLWGANAVNGVINITTKSAKDTQGGLVEEGVGTELKGFGGARYGGKLGPDTYYRVYGKFFEKDDAVYPDGTDASDLWRMGQGGFRLDSAPCPENTFTLQGDTYGGDEDLSTGSQAVVYGGNILGRWSLSFSDGSNMSLQAYYDRTHLSDPVPQNNVGPAGTLTDDLDTYDLDFQHHFHLDENHGIVWGLGYRLTHDAVQNAPTLAFLPATLEQSLFSVFAQDEISLFPKWTLTLGSKVEHNDYTGFEYEPNARLKWEPADGHTLWAAVSRAVRAPSRVDRDIRLPTPNFNPFIQDILIGGSGFESEIVVAYELGYRVQLDKDIASSLSTFYNEYDNVRSTSLSPPDPIFHLPFPLFYANNLEGQTYGVEWTFDVQVLEGWRLHAGYDFLGEYIHTKPGQSDFNNALNETADPNNQAFLRSSMDLPAATELDGAFRWVDSFTYNNTGTAAKVPSYAELDVHMGWHPVEGLELALVGQNLLHDRHAEYVISSPNPPEDIQRSFYGKATWKF